MKFRQSVTYPTDVDGVIAMSLDAEFLQSRFAKACAGPLDIEVTGTCVQVRGEVDPKLIPAAGRALVADRVTFTFKECWTRTEGGAQASTSLVCKGAPVEVKLESTLADVDEGCVRDARGDFVVKVPFFGSKIEKEAISRAEAVVEAEAGLAARWLAGLRG
ncbi:DUF2505 domain-containing protein [Schaalia vaccimaxillae]|uniref:DUF2505 domain-containing protein n=1 Tax=Schaalia vaccimaxillae TaxID=183916 RepID=UPI0003B73D17|nr:DUF2505 domain-containing protein [Schaalia vaccimaxillae]